MFDSEKLYQFIQKHKTNCPCFVCRAKMKFIDYKVRVHIFYRSLRYMKRINVEYRGSDYSDFREYEVIGKGKIRMSDSKGLRWPKTNYNHIRCVEVGAVA